MIGSPRWYVRALDVLTQAALVAAAGACALCTLAPWGTATLFGHLSVQVPGAVYPDGMYVAAAASVAAVIRRSRIVGIAAALICYHYLQLAQTDVPDAIKKAIISAQMTLFPVNSILDQAHLPNLTVGSYGLEKAQYLDIGLSWTLLAVEALFAASIVGILFDPIVTFLWNRFGALPCRRCRKWIAMRRNADYCPRCGLWLPRAPEPLRCGACRNPLNAHDNYCAVCGLSVASSPAEAVSL